MPSRPGIDRRIRAYIRYGEGKRIKIRQPPVEVTHCIGEIINCYGEVIWTFDVYVHDGEKSLAGTILDVRSLVVLKMGCCPEELAAEMIEATRSYEDDRDAVEEAALLHKKGYLGGI